MLVEPLEDPFAPEVVAVPTRGMERWLTQRFSARLGASAGRGDGVCANIGFPFPGVLVGGALAAATGLDPDTDPWVVERLVWPLLEVVDEHIEEPWLRALAAHLGRDRDDADEPRRNRRLGTVRHIAELFDRYAIHRPEMVRAWAGGADTDSAGRELRADRAWQAELWRRLRGRIGEPSPAERLEAACARLRAAADVLELPRRLAVFPLTRLPAAYLQVLGALSAQRDVHLFVLHPSPALWSEVDELLGGRAIPARRSEDPTATTARNRILASWGNDVRELQLVLAAGDDAAADHRHEVPEPVATLLGRLQADVRADRQPPGAPLPGDSDHRPLLEASDRSVRVHACHGRARQVEVIRDEILHLLKEDPTLEPRDVIIMCPDIEAVAPLIQATFGAGETLEDERPEAPDLRVRLADRALRQTNPVLGVISRLVELAEQRATASELLDLADREPVRRRFGFDDDELARIQDWVASSGIRWGLDAGHRKPFKLETLPDGTWRAGLDRVLLGVAMTEQERRLFAGVLPVDDVESAVIELAGRFSEFVDRVRAAFDSLSGRKPIAAWADALASAADALTATPPWESWQRTELQRLLDDVVAEAASADGTEISLRELRALLADRLRGRPTRANFRTGHLTICTLVPMRSVPHRVICVLGLDDGEFPRKVPRDGDDLVLDDPHIGDRDPRSEDRQLLLDALMAASERLIIAYTGNDERTNAPRPPAVPVGELLDIVDLTARAQQGLARDQVIVRHPLQPFDQRNFTPGALIRGGPWSFDRTALEGARALRAPRVDQPPFLEAALPAAD